MNPILAAVLISLVPAFLGAIGFNIAAKYLSGGEAEYRDAKYLSRGKTKHGAPA